MCRVLTVHPPAVFPRQSALSIQSFVTTVSKQEKTNNPVQALIRQSYFLKA